ncbi:MAG: aminotransferase class V-fold PLP-dependent enzyme [Planctomycetes bacterium]|nr:aminotransferase class V-fold PLP-dependent enzyme [Planctomycetota bacterium]
MRRIYLDHNATTPLAPEAREAMGPYLGECYGNPSSVHTFGSRLRLALEEARARVGLLLGADPLDLVFTSGGTEADSAAILGVCAARPDRRHLVATRVEHPAVIEPLRTLERRGYRVTWLEVDAGGRLDPTQVEEALRGDTVLVTAMYANNETGVLFPVDAIGEVCRRRGVSLHVDCVQAAGREALRLAGRPIDSAAVSGHKVHGPKGTGVLYLRRGLPWEPLIRGGHQERGRRGGTENVAALVGLGVAAGLALGDLEAERERVRALRDRLEEGILEAFEDVQVNGDRRARLCNTSNVSFRRLEGEAILLSLDRLGVCVSTGAACQAGNTDPSHVLAAMGVPSTAIHGSVRFSLGRDTTEGDIDTTLDRLREVVGRLMRLAPVFPAEEVPGATKEVRA